MPQPHLPADLLAITHANDYDLIRRLVLEAVWEDKPLTNNILPVSSMPRSSIHSPLLLVAASLFCFGIASPAHAADWVCGAVSASGNTGWSVAPSKAQAQANALAQCGGGCFITGCEYGVGQTVEEAERTRPQEPQRVFNNVPERRILEPRTMPAPVARPQPVRPEPKATASTPEPAQQGKTATATEATARKSTVTPIRSNDCYQPDQRLPTARKIEVNPCADNATALQNLHVPQSRILHQGPQADRYIRSLSNCRQLVNGVCIDKDRKTPGNEAGGPIYINPR